METTTRNADLTDLAEMLQTQQTRKVDVVAPASKIRFEDGVLVLAGTEAVISEDGVTQTDGRFACTTVFDEGLSNKMGIPLPYVRRMRAERPDLYDANANGWLLGHRGSTNVQTGEYQPAPGDVGPDSRSFLIRTFKGDDGGPGIARAFLSDRYKVVDHLDALMAALDGVKRAGVEVNIAGCDLTDRRMYVRIHAPAVQALAPTLLKGYRSPFTGDLGDENPTVFAGFEISNSETGGGAFSITPRLVIQVCNNGMKITKDVLRAVHLGGKQDEGVIRWSEETQSKTVDLIASKTKDAVATFLDVEYMRDVIDGMEEKASTPVPATTTVQHVAKRLSYSAEVTEGILDHFMRGGQITAGGVLNAVTSYAQTMTDADAAAEVESTAFAALDAAAAHA